MSAVTITARNAVAVTGLSWARCKSLALKHGIPVVRLSARTVYITAAALLVAIEREAQPPPPRDEIDLILIAHGVRPR